jgi:hypothetical protein
MDRFNSNLVTGWKRCVGLTMLICAVGILSSPPAAGQGGASISGQLTDQSGGVLPGVTVTATSPALQVPQVTTVTNETGEYRLSPLPIGLYEVTFELAGFQTTRNPNIRLTVGFQARVDASLNVATLEQQVNVTGMAPVVDVASTSSSTVLTKELLELTPTSRLGLTSLMAMAPGVRGNLDVGGNSLVATVSSRSFAQAAEDWFTVEGVAVTGRSGGTAGKNIDYNSIEEARVQSLGTDAEFPTRGVQINVIVKSGGNDFHGAGHWAQSNKNFQGNNIDEELRAIGITSGDGLENRYDLSGEFGGRLVRDKLWFYGSGRKRYEEQSVLGATKPDGSPAHNMFTQHLNSEKLSYQVTPGLRLVGFHLRHFKRETATGDEQIHYYSREDGTSETNTAKIEAQRIFSNTLVGTVQFGGYGVYNPKLFNIDDTIVGREDLDTGVQTGETLAAGEFNTEDRLHYTGNLTWYKPNSFHGNHEVKAGVDYVMTDYVEGFEPKKINYRLWYINGVPEEISLFNTPAAGLNQQRYLGAYLTDSWTIARRLTMNLGIRYSRDNAFVPEQCREAATAPSNLAFPAQCFPEQQMNVWNGLAPRLRAAYDLSGDGRTAIKGGWGRYYRMRNNSLDAKRVNRNGIANFHYRWRDLNGNNDYNPGEANLDPNGPDFLRTTGISFGGATPRAVVNPDEKMPSIDEFSGSIEHALLRDLAFRLTGVHSRYKNEIRIQNNLRPYSAYNIPITNRDPGPDNRLGTADDGDLVTYYEYSRALAPASFEELMAVNSSDKSTYNSFEVAGNKRMANNWQFMASYSATKKNRPLANFAALNPNVEINTAETTWEWDGKLMGAYNFPHNILVSSQLEHRSGLEFARQVLFRGGSTIPSLAVNVEPLGTQRRPNINLVSVRAEKSFRVGNSQRLSVRVNLYNALNANTTVNLTVRSGATYLRPTSILPPRIAEFSASYTF